MKDTRFIASAFLSVVLLFGFIQNSSAQVTPRGFTTYTGTYSSSSSYSINDMVLYQGTTYISIIANNVGNLPSSSSLDWNIIGQTITTVLASQMPALTGDCITTVGTVATVCTKTNGTPFGSAATTNSSAYDASGAATTAQTNAEAAFTGDVTKTANSFATTVTKVNGLAIPTTTPLLGSNGSGQFIAATSTQVQSVIGSGVYDTSGAATAAQANAEAAFTGDVTKTANSFATTVIQVNGAVIPTLASVLSSNASKQIIAATTIGSGSVVLANGTAAAGSYIDGGSEAWTALPFKSLTTTGTGGAATLTGGVLNIPQYSGGGGGLGSVILSGTPVAGAVPLGETSTTADWTVPPSNAFYTVNYHSAGSDICSWIAAAAAALPASGGAISTAGEANFTTSNQCSAANTRAMFAGSYGGTDKFIHLYVGAQTIQIPVQLVVPYGSEISGINLGFPSTSGSVIQATSTYVASEPYTSVSCSGTTQLCTVTTSAATGAVVGTQILVVPTTATGVAPFAQIVTAVTSSTQFVFPEWINCNTTPNTVNCAGGTNYPATIYASLTTGTIIIPMVAIGDIQFSEMTRLDHMTLDMGNVTAGSSIAYFSQTMNESSGSNDLLINNTTYAGFDIEAGANSATLGSGNFEFQQVSIGPTAGVCGRIVQAYANDYRGIHDMTCNPFTASSPLAQGIVFDGPDGENGPFHFENVVDGVVLQGSYAVNTNKAGESLGSAFTIYGVNCYSNVTNCVHNITSTNTPANFTLHDIKSNGATNVYLNAAGTVLTGQYINNYIDGSTTIASSSVSWGGGSAISSSSSLCQSSGVCGAITPTSVAATGSVSGSSLSANGAANGNALLTYTGTTPTAPTTNQWELALNTAITTPWTFVPAAAPSTGVMYGTNVSGVVQQSFTTAPPLTHLVGTAAALPTIAPGTGAGTTPTVVTVQAGSTDLSGYINITPGSAPTAAGPIATVTFNIPYTIAPKCEIWASNAATSALTTARPYASPANTTTAHFVVTANATALTATTAYQWGYSCSQ